jgi:hypothetical protein
MFKRGAITLFLALAAAGVGSLAAEIAQPGVPDSPLISRASGTPVPEDVVVKSIKGNGSDLEDVAGWLLQNNATTEEAGVRAIAVALAASRSPQINSAAAHHQMLERVRQAWSMAVCVPRVFQADTDKDFRPAPGTIAVDFGGAQSARMPGFVRVTDQTPNVAGHNLRPYDNPGGGALFGDGLDGVEEFAVALDNGTYRVTILSISHKSGRYAAAPLGYRILINGERWLIGEAPSPTWLRHGELGGTGLTPVLVSTGSEPLRGGGMTLKATVTDGTLRIAFSQRAGPGASLAGLLIEPVVSVSQVHLFGEALGTNYAIDRCLDFQQQVDNVFQEIADRRNRGIGPGGGPGNSSSGASSSGGDEPPPPSPS